MKRVIKQLALCLALIISVSSLMPLFTTAAPAAPVITMQPQSPNYPEYSVAIYTVKATGSNLTATWYMQWQGKTYNISKTGGAMEPWEAYAGESYGPRKLDSNTFAYIFEGIEYDLNGAFIWCVIEDGHYDVTSQQARVSVGNPASPPEILDISAQITVEQGEEAEIRCVAKAPEGTQLSYLWYESSTGKIEDIIAVNRGTEDSDYLICDTSTPGTYNYICFINTSEGGFANTSFVTVTVTPKAVPAPEIKTKSLPDAVAGEAYTAKLKCSDPDAVFYIYYNPGKDNDFEKAGVGLNLSKDGTIGGTPTDPGTYRFTICAAGAGGEDYREYTLKVVEPVMEPTTEPTTVATEPEIKESEPVTTEPTTVPVTTEAAPTESTDQTSDPKPEPFPWWAAVLVGLGGVGIGVAVAAVFAGVVFFIIKKNKR